MSWVTETRMQKDVFYKASKTGSKTLEINSLYTLGISVWINTVVSPRTSWINGLNKLFYHFLNLTFTCLLKLEWPKRSQLFRVEYHKTLSVLNILNLRKYRKSQEKMPGTFTTIQTNRWTNMMKPSMFTITVFKPVLLNLILRAESPTWFLGVCMYQGNLFSVPPQCCHIYTFRCGEMEHVIPIC